MAVGNRGGKEERKGEIMGEDRDEEKEGRGKEGVKEDGEKEREAADSLGFPFEIVSLDDAVAEEAVEGMVEDGFPRNGIQRVHDHALETIAALDYDAVADGSRRDDRVPTVSRATAQSLEDRHGIDYIAPLAGFGRHAVDDIVAASFEVETGPSEKIPKADYEAELRAILADRHGEDAVGDVFPDHEQTYVHDQQ